MSGVHESDASTRYLDSEVLKHHMNSEAFQAFAKANEEEGIISNVDASYYEGKLCTYSGVKNLTCSFVEH
jgi:hypothetical protein